MSDETTYPWWRKDASVFAALIVFGAIAFTVTYFISKSYGRRQDSLARHWLREGDQNLSAGHPANAVASFRTALFYSHDNPAYKLRLAQALADAGETNQAIAYFLSLLDEQPGNGLYNLELARLYSASSDTRQAARYYNAAIYGAWEKDPAVARRRARTEFVRFLLTHNARAQAQAEAIILAAGVPPNEISTRLDAAKLLFDTGEYGRAMDEYSSLIATEPATAALGAAQSAFQMGRFQSAVRFLNTAIAHVADELAVKTLLQKSKSVLDADPNRRRISSAERARRISDAYDTAGERLQACAAQKKQSLEMGTPPTELQTLYEEWSATSVRVNDRVLRGDPDLRDSIMDLVSRIEETTARACGQPTGPDWTLLMLSRYGEGVSR